MEVWGKVHNISRNIIYDRNYGLSYTNKGRSILARITIEQKNKLLSMGVDQMFISPPLIRRNMPTIHLMLLYYSNVEIDPMSTNYTEQLFEAYTVMYNALLFQFFASSFQEEAPIQ
jgi:hypothetical protein